MHINTLIDAYKSSKNYEQDKQIAHDLGISRQKLSDIRQGRRYLTENEALFLAEEVGADKEMVLVYLAADKAKTYEAQTLWNNIAKKFNGRGLHGLSMACGGLMLWIGRPVEAMAQCVLCTLC
jgi:plasmid maintenance system antidote protein VapI